MSKAMSNPRSKYPRPMRILHVGNIANNAYLNAKILNQAGFDCDVLCYNYEHIMSCPEWEDADFKGTVDSDLHPNWRKVALNGFRRPAWFAQGSFDACMAYLLDRRTRPPRSAQVLRSVDFFCRWAAQKPGLRRLAPPVAAAKNRLMQPDITPIVRRLQLNYHDHFAYREDKLRHTDIAPYTLWVDRLRELFDHYDLVHAYGTDPILPLLVDRHPYLAFEHGTIRSIPFEATPQGRLTALAYTLADGVVITNCDNQLAARKLKLDNYRFVPHPVNETWMQPGIGKTLRKQLRAQMQADFIVFHPARQHWETRRHPSWEKGNDILIHGLAIAINEKQLNIGAVFVEWGQTVDQSKALLRALGIDRRVKWIAPQHSANMSRYIDACDVVADQFYLGAFGSIMPKALGMGRAALIYLNEALHRWCLPELPPVINARDKNQVSDGLAQAYEDRAWLADLSQRGQHWYRKYHSNAVIEAQLRAYYSKILDSYQKDKAPT